MGITCHVIAKNYVAERPQSYSAPFYPNATTLRSGLCYRKSVYRLSSVTFVRPTTLWRDRNVCIIIIIIIIITQAVETFGNIFFATLYFTHPLTAVHNLTEIVPGTPLRRGR